MTSVVGIFDKKKEAVKEQDERDKEGWLEYRANLLKSFEEQLDKKGVGVFFISWELPVNEGQPEIRSWGMFPDTVVKAAALFYFLKKFLDSKMG